MDNFSIRLPQDLKDQLETQASKLDKRLPAYIRDVLEASLNPSLRPQDRDQDSDMQARLTSLEQQLTEHTCLLRFLIHAHPSVTRDDKLSVLALAKEKADAVK